MLGGITGKVRKKLGSVVFASIYGINYARSLVTPANPNTPAQQAQRSKVRLAIEFAKTITTSVIQKFWLNKYPGMSAFNAFMKQNISLTDSTDGITVANKVSSGSLEAVVPDGSNYVSVTGVLTVPFSGAILGNGLETDTIVCVAYDKVNKVSFVNDSGVVRGDESVDFNIGIGRTSENIIVFLFAYRGTGTSLITSTSNAAVPD